MQIKKVIASLAASICLFANSGVAAYAETTTSFVDDGISLMYEIADNLTSELDIADRTAYCVSKATSKDAVSITVTQTLQKYWGLWIWNSVDGAEWTKTVDRNSINVSNSIGGLDNGKYRLKSVFTLTDKNGKSETITVCSSEQKIG